MQYEYQPVSDIILFSEPNQLSKENQAQKVLHHKNLSLYEKSPLREQDRNRWTGPPPKVLKPFSNPRGEPNHLIPKILAFCHDQIDFQRIIEIDKQELVLQNDYNISTLF